MTKYERSAAELPVFSAIWLLRLDSNQRPTPYESAALPLSYAAIWCGRQDLNLRMRGMRHSF